MKQDTNQEENEEINLEELLQRKPQEIRQELLKKQKETLVMIHNNVFGYFELKQEIPQFPEYTFSKSNKEQIQQKIITENLFTTQEQKIIPAYKWKLNGTPLPEIPIIYAIIISNQIKEEYKPYYALHEFIRITNKTTNQDFAVALREEIKIIQKEQEKEQQKYWQQINKLKYTSNFHNNLLREEQQQEKQQEKQLIMYLEKRQEYYEQLLHFTKSKEIYTQQEKEQIYQNNKAIAELIKTKTQKP